MMCDEKNKIELKGEVKSGLGNANIWVKKARDIFKEKYGMDLFLGTLNIELDREIILEEDEKILPHEYGGIFNVYVKECEILNTKAYILRTEKNNKVNGDHPLNIIEIVTNVNMRKEYGLKDNDKVSVYIYE